MVSTTLFTTQIETIGWKGEQRTGEQGRDREAAKADFEPEEAPVIKIETHPVSERIAQVGGAVNPNA